MAHHYIPITAPEFDRLTREDIRDLLGTMQTDDEEWQLPMPQERSKLKYGHRLTMDRWSL